MIDGQVPPELAALATGDGQPQHKSQASFSPTFGVDPVVVGKYPQRIMFADAQLLTMFFFCVETPRFLDISLSRLTKLRQGWKSWRQ